MGRAQFLGPKPNPGRILHRPSDRLHACIHQNPEPQFLNLVRRTINRNKKQIRKRRIRMYGGYIPLNFLGGHFNMAEWADGVVHGVGSCVGTLKP